MSIKIYYNIALCFILKSFQKEKIVPQFNTLLWGEKKFSFKFDLLYFIFSGKYAYKMARRKRENAQNKVTLFDIALMWKLVGHFSWALKEKKKILIILALSFQTFSDTREIFQQIFKKRVPMW